MLPELMRRPRRACAGLIVAAGIAAGAAGAQPTPIATPPAAAEAPFGLAWLASKRSVRALGVEPRQRIATEFGDSWVVSRLPKELADMHYAVLSFGDADQLIRILAVGGGFDGDRDGARVRARYAELDALLAQKYGPGIAHRHVEKAFEGERFALGLHSKRNWMYAEYPASDMRVQLSIFWEAAKTYWRLLFEQRPGMARLRESRRTIDRDAFQP